MPEPTFAPLAQRSFFGVAWTGVLAALACGCALLGMWAGLRGSLLGLNGYGEVKVEGDAFPKRLIDPAGAVHVLARPPQRIVSATLAGDEILTALIDPDRLVGVSKLAENSSSSNCSELLPKQAARLVHAETEAILRLQPDLVVVAAYTRAETVRVLVAMGIPVVRSGRFETFENIFSSVRLLGRVTGTESKAQRLIRDTRARLDAVEKRVQGKPRPRVLYFVLRGFTAGEDTLLDEMITRAGGANIARELGLKGNAQISIEAVLELKPEIVIVPSWTRDGAEAEVAGIMENPVWRSLPAVRKKQVYAIPSAQLTTLSHYAVRGVEHMAQYFHSDP